MITVYVVDDEEPALRTMKSYIDRTAFITCLGYESDPVKARQWLEKNINALPDIVFLDVEMKKLKGLVLAAILKGKTKIVFSTAHAEFAVVSYDFDTVDYLLKPFEYERFLQAVEKCLGPKNEDDNNETLILKDAGNRITKLCMANITHIDAHGNYVKIYMEDGTFFMPILTLKKAIETLTPFDFLQIHKSHVVNLQKVKSFTLNTLELENGMKFTVSRKLKVELREGMERINLTKPRLK